MQLLLGYIGIFNAILLSPVLFGCKGNSRQCALVLMSTTVASNCRYLGGWGENFYHVSLALILVIMMVIMVSFILTTIILTSIIPMSIVPMTSIMVPTFVTMASIMMPMILIATVGIVGICILVNVGEKEVWSTI